MKRYLAYLWYVLKHKWFVMIECFKMGLIWQGIIHDLSKFHPEEFMKYARVFYDKDGKKQNLRNKDGSYDASKILSNAWHHHVMSNKHHWQYWILVEDMWPIEVYKIRHNNNEFALSNNDIAKFTKLIEEAKKNQKPIVVLDDMSMRHEELMSMPHRCILIPKKYLKEMLCDWCGAARAQGKEPDILEFYEKNKDKMAMNHFSRQAFKELIKKHYVRQGYKVYNNETRCFSCLKPFDDCKNIFGECYHRGKAHSTNRDETGAIRK